MDKFKFDQTIPSSDSYDSVCCFDDEVDAALAPDFRVSKMVNELSEVEIDDEDDNEYYEDDKSYEDDWPYYTSKKPVSDGTVMERSGDITISLNIESFNISIKIGRND